MYKVVLLRHGESEWNRENRFTDGPMCRFPKGSCGSTVRR